MTVDTTTSPNKPGKSNTNPTTSPSATLSVQQQNQSPSSTASTTSSSQSSNQMTHQQQQQQSPSNPNVIKKNRSEVIKTIQEITKFDEYTINEAIEACQDSEGRYSMDQVLNILMDEKYSNEQNNQQDASSSASKGQFNRYNRQNANDPSSNGNDSTKYLTRSASSGQAANQSGSTSERASGGPTNSMDYHANIYGSAGSNNLDEDLDDFDFDSTNSPLAPQRSTGLSTSGESSLIREDGKPSGLKNVGNTCWFNSIIQTFFHLPYFRRLILSFNVDQNEINRLDENSRNVVQFVAEFKNCFH